MTYRAMKIYGLDWKLAIMVVKLVKIPPRTIAYFGVIALFIGFVMKSPKDVTTSIRGLNM